MKTWFHQWGSPPHFYGRAARWIPWLGLLAAGTIAYGLVGGLVLAPADYQQGQGYRIIFVHVPSAWMSMFIYTSMAVAAAIALIWRMKVAEVYITAAAPIGASFTFLALLTGALWGKPMWGAYWVWDARLTSELILLFLYLGVIGLYSAIEDKRSAARAASVLTMVGVVNIPIIHYSVEWWHTLHQGSTITKLGKPSMDPAMLWPLLSMALGFTAYFGAIALLRMRVGLLKRERYSRWVAELVSKGDVS